MPRQIVIEHLTLLELPILDYLATSAAAGFDGCGLRLIPARPNDIVSHILDDVQLTRAIPRALSDLGLLLLDIETLALGPTTRTDDYLPALECGAQWGARFLNVTGNDDSESRFHDSFARLVAESEPFGITPLLEPMAWKPLRTLAAALRAVQHADGGGVQLDTLHLQRCGVSIAELSALPPETLGYVQLSDGAIASPTRRTTAPELLAEHRPAETYLQLEARLGRSLPGTGELPITTMLESLPGDIDPATPVGVEVPDIVSRKSMDAATFARKAYLSTRSLAEHLS